MTRARKTLTRGLPVGAGMVIGALLVTALAGQPAGAAQDTATQMQIQQLQQTLGNYQIQLQNQLNLMQSKIDTLEQQQRNMRLELNDAAREKLLAPTPIAADPIPGTTTYGRLVSEASQSYRYELHSPSGELRAQLGMTSDGPGLVFLDAAGAISMALVATPSGPELRMADADGNLQTVVGGQ